MGLEFSVNCCRDVDWFVSRKQQQQTNTDLNTEEHLNVIMLRISSVQKILITIFFPVCHYNNNNKNAFN